MATLGGNLEAARIEAGFASQAAVAAALDISLNTWNRWATDRARPGVNTLIAIAKALGTSASALLDGVDTQTD